MITSKANLINITKTITPSMRYDFKEDYSSWRARAKDKLMELLGLPLVMPTSDDFKAEAPEYKNGMTYIRFTFRSEEGYYVPACLVKKTNLKGKAPLVICLQGHSTGMHISLGEPKYPGDEESIKGGRAFALDAAKEGCVAIAVEQRYMGVMGYGGELGKPSCLADSNPVAAQANAALLIGRCAIGERVWDVMRTIDAALLHFGDMINEDEIICLGNSGGGTTTFYASCIDERIAISVPSCSVCTYEDSIIALYHCFCNYVPNIRKYFDMGDIGGLLAPRKLVLVCGKEDKIFPLPGVEKSFALIKGVYEANADVNNCRLVVGNAGHQFYPDEAWPIIHELLGK